MSMFERESIMKLMFREKTVMPTSDPLVFICEGKKHLILGDSEDNLTGKYNINKKGVFRRIAVALNVFYNVYELS